MAAWEGGWSGETETDSASPMDRPAVRIRDLEEQLASHRERAVVCGGMFLFFGVLATLGFIKWRRLA